jgi:predicted RNase H-like HicB family nuclease
MTKNYLVVYAKSPGSNFAGHAPDVPGCVSVGDTLDEMRTMMREALEFHLEGLAHDGLSIPEALTHQVDFRDQDFEDAEYFVVEHLAVQVPVEQTNEAIPA